MDLRDQRYLDAQAIVHAVVDLDSGERAAAVAAACGDDVALRAEVEWLLVAIDDPGSDRLAAPAASLAADLTSDVRVVARTPREFRLLRPLGEGGMGQVWLAERGDGDTRQQIALKLLRGVATPDAAALERFRTEARILAGLEHPNIARLVDSGTSADGLPFIAMEYVDGTHLSDWCNAQGLNLRQRIEAFLKVCDAVAYAHQQLVIHRDLKPGNILVNSAGEPKLLDFGIARLLQTADAETLATRAMTSSYASPEQLEGKPLGTATDVYSLGIVLYELVSGVHPFAHLASEHARTSAALSGDVTRPGAIGRFATAADAQRPHHGRARRLPADIDAIVMKAIRREPADRYATVGEFAHDLQRFLQSRPVVARRGQWSYRARRFARRNRWPIVAVTVVLATIAAFTWQTWRAEQHATREARIADRVSGFLVSVFAASDSNLNNGAHRDLTAIDVLDSGARRIEHELADEPRVRARLLESIANAYRHMNANRRAARLMRQAAELNLSAIVDDPLAASRCYEALANIMANGGFPASEATDAARQSLRLATQTTAPGSQAIANAWMVLSLAHLHSGNLDLALAAAKKTSALNQARAGLPDIRIQPAEHNLCLILSTRGDQIAARPHCLRKLELARGEKSISVTMTEWRLALTWLRSGDYQKADATIRKALAMATAIEGDDGLFVASYKLLRARVLDLAGHYAEAGKLLHAVADVRARHAGINSGPYASVMEELAHRDVLLGRFDSAIARLRRVVQFRRGYDDPAGPPLLAAETALAAAELARGDAGDDVRALLDHAASGWSDKDFAPPLAAARTSVALAHWHLRHGGTATAERLLGQVDTMPVSDPWLKASATRLKAAIARQRGDNGEAIRLEQAAFDALEARYGIEHPQVARLGLELARELRRGGHAATADSLARRAGPVVDRAFPDDSTYRNQPATSASNPPRRAAAMLPTP